MLKRQFLEKVIKGEIDEEVIAFATESLEKLTSAQVKKQEENEPLLDAIYAILSDEPITAAEVNERLAEITSTQKASALLRKLVLSGRAKVEDIKEKNKRPVKGYTKAAD